MVKAVVGAIVQVDDVAGLSRRGHGYHIAERRAVSAGGRPHDRIQRFGLWKASIEIRKDNKRLGLNAVVLDVIEASAEVGSTSADRIKSNGLALLEHICAV